MEDATKYDLTGRMAPLFDVHMVAPLLDYLREVGLYDARVLTVEKIRAVDSTHMIELIEDEYEKMVDSDEQLRDEYMGRKSELEARKVAIFAQIDNEPAEVSRVAAVFANEDIMGTLRANGELTMEALQTQCGVSAADMDAYVKFSKFKYECGMYSEAEAMLSSYLAVQAQHRSGHHAALWGRLACRIVTANWEGARDDLKSLKASVDGKGGSGLGSAADQLKQRAWLLHWGLFVLLNQRDAMDALYDFIADKSYLATVQNMCPWLLRYLAVAAVLSPRRRALIKDLLHEIQVSSYLYSDPITQLLESLFDHFDFDAAQRSLRDCRVVMRNDFFLCVFADKFVDEARALLCELYCTVNRRVDLSTLASKLEVSEDEAERWVVSMVRSGGGGGGGAVMDARIDSVGSSGRRVEMMVMTKSAHQTISDKTRDLTIRGAMLAMNVEAVLGEQAAYIKHRVAAQ